MTANPYTKLFLVCDSAEQFVEASKDPERQDEFRLFSILACLLAAEEILDKGRNAVSFDEAPNQNDKQLVNKRMDKIRGEIVELLKKLSEIYGKEKVTDFLQSRIRGMQNIWFSSF
jgi:hypothetical protein